MDDLRTEVVRPRIARAIQFRWRAAAAGELELHDCFHAAIPRKTCGFKRS
jgi:hypothetical protein